MQISNSDRWQKQSVLSTALEAKQKQTEEGEADYR